MSRRALSRNVQAFEALLASDDEDDAAGGSRRGSKAKGKGAGRGGGRHGGERVPGFKLRDGSGAAAPPPPDPLAALREMFGAAASDALGADVLAACGGDLERAVEAMLAMGAAPGGASAPAVSPPAARSTTGAAAAGPDLWDSLPEEVKEQILAVVPLRDLARAAGASREFAARVRAARANCRAVVVPEGLSAGAVRGLVRAYGAAHEVDLSRWRESLRFPEDVAALAAAVAAGAAERRPSVPVESVRLGRCAAVDAAAVATLCAALRELRAVDLSRCAGVDDAALPALARYRRDAGDSSDDDNAGFEATPALEALALGGGDAASAGAALESPAQAVARLAAAEQARRAAARGGGGATSAGAAGGLEELRLAGTGIASRGVADLLGGAGRAPALRLLDVSRCARVADLALGPRAPLRVLRAAGLPALRAVAIQLPAGAPLRELRLADCRSLVEVAVSAPALEELNVSGCVSLRSLSVRCSALITLLASGCGALRLGPDALGALECQRLEALNLFGCRLLDAEALEGAAAAMPALAELDVGGCAALARLAPPPGALAALRRLAADGCASLRRVHFAAPRLESASLRGCAALLELRLPGALPRELDLENCAALEHVVLGGGGAAAAPGERRRLVTRGCASLLAPTRERLRRAVLRRGG
jgi:hypothetical protein